MRKRISVCILAALFILAAVFILSFSACAKKQTQSANAPYSAAWDGKVYTVTPADANTGTITDGTYTYSYRYEPSGSSYEVIFTYPDGETYKWSDNGTGAVCEKRKELHKERGSDFPPADHRRHQHRVAAGGVVS